MIAIRLHRIYYPVTALGPGRRLGVWVQGCMRGCPDCLSPEMQPEAGPFMPVAQIVEKIPGDIQPDGLTISGGEPFDQPEAVLELVRWFTRTYTEDVLIYTGYTLQELQAREDSATDAILSSIAALVDGPYLKQQNSGKGLIGSLNQHLYVYRFQERYQNFLTAERKIQAVQEQKKLLFIGIPPQNN